jgi:hypothetical protein
MKAVLNYKVRIERMESGRWVRRIFEWNLSVSAWEKVCKRQANKLNIPKIVCVRYGISADEWFLRNQAGGGIEWDCKKWKKKIERTKEYGLDKWKKSMNGKTSLVWYAQKKVPRTEILYDDSYGSQLLFGVRCKTLRVNRRKWRWNEGKTRMCMQCNSRVEETI